MKKLGLALCLFVGLAPAHAQPTTNPVSAGIAGAYNTGTVTCTNLQFCFLQTDVNGNVKVVLSGTPSGTQDINIKQYGGVAVGATNAQYVQPGTGALWTLSAETTKVIGTVNQGTSPWVISGALTANQSVNVAQMNGVTTTMGNGVAGTGVQRVAVASDNTAFSVNATLATNTANTYVGNVNTQSPKTTYRAAASAAIDAAGVLLQLQGTASKTVRVTRVMVTGEMTVSSNGRVFVERNSTGLSGGTCVTTTIGSLDTTNAAATAIATNCSAVPTPGTSVANVATQSAMWPADTALGTVTSFTFGDLNGQGLVVRGTSEYLSVRSAGFGSYTGAIYAVTIEWTEE